MVDTRTAPPEVQAPDLVDQELVIREARRRQRRRWLATGAVVVLVAGVVVATVGLASAGTTSRPSARHPSRTRRIAPTGPTTTGITPKRPGSLAIGPNGNLYMADSVRNQILERLPDGTFEPVAGNGTPGFSGDGGPATSAQLSDPSGITFGPHGTLYIADYTNGRIRAVTPDGRIHTIAGDGQGFWVADGTPATAALLTPNAVAFSPSGQLYVSDQSEVLRLDANDTFSRILGENANDHQGLYGIAGPAVNASADGATGLAFDSAGNLYVFGFNTKSILMVDPGGIVRSLGTLYPRGPSGLATAPDGSVIAMNELGVVRLSPQGIQTLVTFPTSDKFPYLGITGLSPNGIALGMRGTIYLDTFSGNGYADKSAIIAIREYGSGRASSLWQQSPR